MAADGAPPTSNAPASDSADPPAQPAAEPKRGGVLAFLLELPILILIAFVLALLLKTFVVQAFYIPSSSMVPTLEVEDRVLVNKMVYGVRDPQRGEVVVFAPDGELTDADAGAVTRFFDWLSTGLGMSAPEEQDFIKRIVGLPGETIEVRDGVVLIDDIEVPESSDREGGYLSARDASNFGPLELGSDEYFMMGDNRGSSLDSRSDLGTIRRGEIVGRAFVIIWPFSNATGLTRPDYSDAVSATERELIGGTAVTVAA